MLAWNQGQYDSWPATKGPIAMSYMTRDDIPYHYALADAFTVGDAYYCSIMGPTNPNRCYLWTGCVGNVNYLGSGGTDGLGAGPVTANGLSPNNAYFVWETFPEVLQAAGVSWKIYQDLAGATFRAGFRRRDRQFLRRQLHRQFGALLQTVCDFRSGHAAVRQRAVRVRESSTLSRARRAPSSAWQAWAEQLFDDFRSDVQGGKLPQVSWIVATGRLHRTRGLADRLRRLVHLPDLRHPGLQPRGVQQDRLHHQLRRGRRKLRPPRAAHAAADHPLTGPRRSASKTRSSRRRPRTARSASALGCRFLAISPWSKGGYVNSQVFDHTSVIQFIEKRFGVLERNISPWRRAVAGDLTSVFNFADPNARSRRPAEHRRLSAAGERARGRKRHDLRPHSGWRDHRRAEAGKRYPPCARLALRVGCSRVGQCFDSTVA